MSAVLAGALALGIVLGGLELADVSLVDLLRDPSAVSDSPWWSGSISLVGLLFWGGTAGVLLLAGLVLRDVGEPVRARFYLVSAAVAAWFAFDDALLVHEEVLPNEAGLPRLLVLVLYGALAGAWALRFRRELAGDFTLLAIVAGSFAASGLLDNADALPGVDVGYRAGVLEDYAKYVGLVALLAWALTVTRRELLAARRPARESADTLRP